MVHRIPAAFLDRRCRFGVTLVETILVVMLLAAATVAGSFMLDGQWRDRRGATDVTREVYQTLVLARNTAIASRTNVAVRQENVRGRQWLTIVEEAGPMRAGKKWQIDLGDQPTISGSPTEIWFKATGSADRGLEWKVSEGSLAGLVQVTPTDGNVTHRLP
ncbi:hypothetical protein Poly51_33750 [Rubripirellula tenax]|uniref:General secretion pathway GspH domain-containing protein n=1 Tax=Rubripirellula tenax TaxID=2528015 RepID=A0A5C6F3N6_9BACT|nr:hypothetical protein [Rubripirellula tenax]TWU54656.1 hypothetical protein Poly51_33750 [Rubripirellula tenax]